MEFAMDFTMKTEYMREEPQTKAGIMYVRVCEDI